MAAIDNELALAPVPDGRILTTSGWRTTTIILQDRWPNYNPNIMLCLFGPKGGFRDSVNLTKEEAWLLGDMLIELSKTSKVVR